jgi:hypothetical protein
VNRSEDAGLEGRNCVLYDNYELACRAPGERGFQYDGIFSYWSCYWSAYRSQRLQI